MKKSSMFLFACVVVPVLALAQPGGSGSAPAPTGSAPVPTPGSAPAPTPGSGTAAPAPSPTPEPATGDAAAARKACTEAMNADPTFAKSIVDATDKYAAEVRAQKDLMQHSEAAAAVAKNQKHVILAYAAMWIIAAAFVMFLWMRQQALKTEIRQLKLDLDAATKEGK